MICFSYLDYASKLRDLKQPVLNLDDLLQVMVALGGKLLNSFFTGVKHVQWICSVWGASFSFALPRANIHLATILNVTQTSSIIGLTCSWWIIYLKLFIFFLSYWMLNQIRGKGTFLFNFVISYSHLTPFPPHL